jgi:hypothetical protein
MRRMKGAMLLRHSLDEASTTQSRRGRKFLQFRWAVIQELEERLGFEIAVLPFALGKFFEDGLDDLLSMLVHRRPLRINSFIWRNLFTVKTIKPAYITASKARAVSTKIIATS